MAHLIDKDPLVAEIDRLDALYHTSKSLGGDLFIQGLYCFLDTHEVKELDFETAFATMIDVFDEKCGQHWREEDLKEFAKHFFELGLKAKQG